MLVKKNIIFICTGNACRSQIAHGLLESMAGDKFEVFSAGSHPSQVHPMSTKIMEEILDKKVGIDIDGDKKPDIKMSVPEGMEFNKSYSVDPKYSKYY